MIKNRERVIPHEPRDPRQARLDHRRDRLRHHRHFRPLHCPPLQHHRAGARRRGRRVFMAAAPLEENTLSA